MPDLLTAEQRPRLAPFTSIESPVVSGDKGRTAQLYRPLVPFDLIRLGVLYLHGGNWNGHQLIPSQWVAQSTDYATVGVSIPDVRYGTGWWTHMIDGTRVYYAWGDHGEFILVAPSRDIIVARFGRQYAFGAPRGNSSGGSAGVQTWPQVLTRIATTVAARKS